MTNNHHPRLLHVITRDHARGAENVAMQLVAQLQTKGWDQSVAALLPSSGEQGRLPVQVLGRSRISALRSLRRLVKSSQPDVILAHGGLAAATARVATAGTETRVVWQRILEFPPSVWNNPLQLALWRWVARGCSGAVALSKKAEIELSRLGFIGPTAYIPNHRPMSEATPARDGRNRTLPNGARVPDGVPLFGFAGHLVHQKNPLAAVRVAERVLQRLPEAHFAMAGSGPLSAQVAQALARSPQRDRIHLLGHVSDIPQELLSKLDLLLISSRTESMTGVAVECLMAACPVAAYQLDGLHELLVETGAGLLVPRGAEDELSEAIIGLLQDPSILNAMRASALKHRHEFSSETAAERYDSLLREVIQPSPTPMNPRTVVHLMPNIGVGGAEQALHVLARHHDRKSWTPIVVTLHDPRRPTEETILPQLKELGVEVVSLRISGRADRSPLALAQAALALRRFVRTRRVTILDSALFEADVVARAALLGLSTKHVTHLVNTTYENVVHEAASGRGRWRFEGVRLVDSLSGTRTDHFVALTEAVRDSARSHLNIPSRKISVIPRGVVLDDFPAVKHVGEVRRLLTVGRLVPQKNHLRLIEAIERVPGLSLTILGEGPLRAEIDALIDRRGLHTRVTVHPPTRNVAAIHRQHDAFLLPSLWEGQSNALLEAMSSGMAVVAADIRVLREVLGPNGIYVDPLSVDSIADGLLKLQSLNTEQLQELSIRISEHVHANYSAGSSTERLEALYDKLAT